MLLRRVIRKTRIARTILATGLSMFAAFAALQCSASSDNNVGGGANGGSGNGAGFGGSHKGGNGSGGIHFDQASPPDYSAEAFFINDPPPTACDGGGIVKVPGGTPQCPDDKNLEGCPCTVKGQTAACWPGLRKNRNHGNCKDGQTTCGLIGENKLAWGPCQGFQGIDPNTFLPLGTTGKAACLCFSGGQWKIDNLSPCFISSSQGGPVVGAVSTYLPGPNCPDPNSIDFNNPVPPTTPWSTDSVKADCSGHFKLCYTLKALSAPKAPRNSAGDCVLKQVCTEGHLDQADTVQTFPDLPGWITQNSAENACAQSFVTNGGYGEMSVVGESDECDQVPDHIFNTVTYCPLKCTPGSTDPDCVNCMTGGSGNF